MAADKRDMLPPEVHDIAPDAVFDYSSTVLNDDLLMLEFRDAIHERDGDRILRCWKFLLLYFRFAGRTKYAIEAFNMLTNVNATCSTRLAAQIKWSRVILQIHVEDKETTSLSICIWNT